MPGRESRTPLTVHQAEEHDERICKRSRGTESADQQLRTDSNSRRSRIVGDESRSLLGNLSDGRFERFALISASPETAWELVSTRNDCAGAIQVLPTR